MLWAPMLAYITGSVQQELLLRSEYLAAESRIRSMANCYFAKLHDMQRIFLYLFLYVIDCKRALSFGEAQV